MWLELIAAIFAIMFIVYKQYFEEQTGNKKASSGKVIPGVEPSDPIDGNKPDIEKAGTIGEYVRSLHKKHGPIVRFYEGKKMSVSIGAPEMLKQMRHLFESSIEILEQFEMVTGPELFIFSGVDEIKRRRKVYDQHFMMGACKTYSGKFKDLTKETADSLLKIGKPFSLMKTTTKYSLNALLRCCFGDVFKNEEKFAEYQDLVDFVFRNFDPKPKEDTDLYKEVVQKCNRIREMVQEIMDKRREQTNENDTPELFIDILMNMDITEAARKADVTAFVSGGYFTVGIMLCWFFYEISHHPEIQEKIHQEIVSVLGEEDVTVENMSKLTYLRQVIDETLRVYLSPLFTARIAETDLEIAGYHIPKGTPIYQAFEPLFNDPKVWKDPQRFDPDRFSRENSRGRNPLSFKPFGFAGKRNCPGMNFALSEMIILSSEVIRRCRINLVPGQKVEMLSGFIVAPKNDIMVTVEKR